MAETFQDRIIRQHVKGLTFIDVGGLWGTVNEKVTAAAKAGAASLAMADMQPEGDELWAAFHQHATQRGCADYASYPDQNLDDPMVDKALGSYDFVHCSGVLYHVPSPLFTLERLRSITRKYLLIGSMVVPDVIKTRRGSLSFEGGRMVYLPGLDPECRAILAMHFDTMGLKLSNINGEEEEFRIEGGLNYSPWWWLYSAKSLAAMVEVSGFKIIDQGSEWDGRVNYVFCQRRD